MREFIRRAIGKSSKMNQDQLQSLLTLVTEEYEVLDAVLDSFSVGVVICDSFHVIVQSNKAAARILPLDVHDVQDRPAWDCLTDDDVARFVRTAIEGEEGPTAKEFALELSASTRYVAVSVFPLVRSKSVRGTIITAEDITERKAEETRNRRLESLASLTNLAATVAHEIKNPLGSIGIHVQLVRKSLAKDSGGKVPDPVGRYLDVVDEEISRLNKIVVDFLFAVRPINLEFAPLDLNRLVRDLAGFFGEVLSRANIALELDLAEGLPEIQGDDRHLRQMLINLIKNAMAAMLSGGQIRVRTRRDDDFIAVTVEDTGTGIPADLLHKIFEPYFTTKVDGTGLGLTMAYKVVKEHGGDIRVQSEDGKGATLTVKLPVIRRAQKMIGYEETAER